MKDFKLNNSHKNILKYIIFTGIVYSLLKVVPVNAMNKFETFVIVATIIVGFVSLDCLIPNNVESMGNTDNKYEINLNTNDSNVCDSTSSDSSLDLISDDELKEEQKDIPSNDISSSSNISGNVVSDIVSHKHPETSCHSELESVRREFKEELLKLKNQLKTNIQPPQEKKTSKQLIKELIATGAIDAEDVKHLNNKVRSGLMTKEEARESLQKLADLNVKSVPSDKKVLNDMKYSELPSEYYETLGENIDNDWDNNYALLNTNKWAVPEKRPPVCISTTPCQVCPTNTVGNATNLKEWDYSRKISDIKLNKQWTNDNTSS